MRSLQINGKGAYTPHSILPDREAKLLQGNLVSDTFLSSKGSCGFRLFHIGHVLEHWNTGRELDELEFINTGFLMASYLVLHRLMWVLDKNGTQVLITKGL